MRPLLMLSPKIEFVYRLLFALLSAVLIMLGVAWLLSISGCGWGAAACRTIDTAKDACNVIRYLGPNGQVVEVQVSGDELQGFAYATKMARARAAAARTPDGGAP